MHRQVRTTAERRENGHRCSNGISYSDEHKVKIRAKRSMKMLPEAWDDILRQDWNFRSWKRHRKTQWKPISHVMANDTSLLEVFDEYQKNLVITKESASKESDTRNDRDVA